jgi:NAD+ synthase (glutamine-hydrolysing)
MLLKIALAQIDIIPGRPDLNAAKMLSFIQQAEKTAHIIIFPELAIPGYLLGDTWEQSAFLRDCEAWGQRIAAASANTCIIFGNVAVDWKKTNDDGRVRKYNACFVAQNGHFIGNENFPYPFRIKTLQPNYREFEDDRHFCSLRKLSMELGQSLGTLLQPLALSINGQSLRLGCVLCEDGWSDDYSVKPIPLLQNTGPIDLFINISSSPFTLGKNNKRHRSIPSTAAAPPMGAKGRYVCNVHRFRNSFLS